MISESLLQTMSGWLAGSQNLFLKKIASSIQRDKSYPFQYYIKKAFLLISSTAASKLYLRKCDKVGDKSRTRRKPNIENSGRIEVGNYFHLNSKNVACDLVAMPEGRITIGDEVFINYGTSIVAQEEVRIGNKVRIGPFCMIHDTDFHVIDDFYQIPQAQPVVIEDGVWLAAKVIILKGSLIGEGSIIGAGSVVSGIIPPHCLAAGIPAKVIKRFPVPGTKPTNFKCEEDYDFQIVFGAVKKLISNYFNFPEAQISGTTSPNHIPGWSANEHNKLQSELQKYFNVCLDENEMVSLINVHKIASAIYRKKNSAKNIIPQRN